MSNSKEEYNTFIRANLPFYITYDSVRNQYVTQNGKRFVTYKEAKWYMDYIVKFGYVLVPIRDGVEPSLYLDFTSSLFATRELDDQDYKLQDVTPELLLDFTNQTYGA